MKKILIMHQTITSHDAIGNDIECMFQILSETTQCKCYAENALNKKVDYVSEKEARDIIGEKDSIIIYHHSINWPLGEQMIKGYKGVLVFRYHNITPADFFAPYHSLACRSCEEGRRQTDRLISEFPAAFWLSGSGFNCLDLQSVPKEKLCICPPFHKTESWSKAIPDEQIMKRLIYGDTKNILFVGRVAPNKGHLALIDVMRIYRDNFDDKIKLHIIGKFDEGMPGYNQLIRDRIHEEHMESNIEFVGEINDSILMAYYLGCDAYLCMSEHEGFCVPIIEAQYFGLPVVAMKSSAVTETLGDNQILLEDDKREYAAALNLVVNNLEIRKYLRYKGFANFTSRFSYTKIAEIFQDFINAIGGSET